MMEFTLGAAGGTVAGLGLHAWLQRHDFSLTEYRTRLRGVADLVNYEEVIEDGIVLLKNGGLLATWRVFGRDLEAASGRDLSQLMQQISDAVSTLGTGWMWHVDAVRSPAAGYPMDGAFPDATTWMLDQERRALYETEGTHYTSDVTFSFTFLPPPAAREWIARWFFSRNSRRRQEEFPGLREFKATIDDLTAKLFTPGSLRAERLGAVVSTDADGVTTVSDELLRHLHRCVTCIDRPVAIVDADQRIDRLVGDQDFVAGRFPKMGRYHVRCVSIERLPVNSIAAMLQHLNLQSASYRWSTRAIILSEPDANRAINRRRSQHRLNRLSLSNYIRKEAGGEVTHTNSVAEESVADTLDALGVNGRHDERFAYYSAAVVLWSEDETEVNDQAQAFETLINDLQCTARKEEVNVVETFLSTWPGHGHENQRVFLVRMRGIVNALPITRVFGGHPEHPSPRMPVGTPALALCSTEGASTQYFLNLHVGEVGTTLIIGNSGAGKTTLLNLLEASFFRYPRAQVARFGMNFGDARLCRAAGGSHRIVGQSGRPEFALIAEIDDTTGRARAKVAVERLLRLRNVAFTPDVGPAVARAIDQLALRPKGSRRITDLVTQIQLPEARQALDYYTEDQPGGILDGEYDPLFNEARFTSFELDNLKQMPLDVKGPLLLHMLDGVQRRLRAGTPTLIPVDEAWNALADDIFREQLEEWVRTARALDGVPVFATQGVDDIVSNPAGRLLLSLAATKIFLANPAAITPAVRPAYEAAGLSAKQIALIASMVPAKEYYLVNEDGSRKFELGLGPCQLEFLATNNRPENRTLWEYFERDPEAKWWPAALLRDRELEDWADYWEAGPAQLRQSSAPPRYVAPPTHNSRRESGVLTEAL